MFTDSLYADRLHSSTQSHARAADCDSSNFEKQTGMIDQDCRDAKYDLACQVQVRAVSSHACTPGRSIEDEQGVG